MSNRLPEKFGRVFDLKADDEAKRFLDRLRYIAEQWRNPYGHGLFDKQHSTLSFHLPGIGA